MNPGPTRSSTSMRSAAPPDAPDQHRSRRCTKTHPMHPGWVFFAPRRDRRRAARCSIDARRGRPGREKRKRPGRGGRAHHLGSASLCGCSTPLPSGKQTPCLPPKVKRPNCPFLSHGDECAEARHHHLAVVYRHRHPEERRRKPSKFRDRAAPPRSGAETPSGPGSCAQSSDSTGNAFARPESR